MNRISPIAPILMLLAMVSVGTAADRQTTSDKPNTRDFHFDYGATLHELPVGARVRVWLPVPQSSEYQLVERTAFSLPTRTETSLEPVYGNRILYFETKGPKSASVTFNLRYRVRRSEVRGLASNGRPGNKLTPKQQEIFLSANRRVPLEGKQRGLLDNVNFSSDSLDTARKLYEIVDEHVRYDKSQPGYGNGDVHWVCDSRFGNCTDFHSLFISLSRSKGLPSRFEIGFPLPPVRGEGTVGGYHCWALFHHSKKGWVPVDISEADKHPELREYYFGNLTENRVTFTTGRDINLVPRQDGPPLNYFVYPYVEVDGQVWPSENLQTRFNFKDR